MYSRSYYAEDTGKIGLPDNYNGTTFMDQPMDRSEEEVLEHKKEGTVEASAQPSGAIKIPFLSSLFSSGNGHGLISIPEIGLEEILIIATAAFLFFSKDGDKECAIILLLVLLVN